MYTVCYWVCVQFSSQHRVDCYVGFNSYFDVCSL